MVLTVLGAFGVAGLWVAAFGPKHMTTRNVVYLVLGVAASSTWMLLEPEFSRRFLFFFLAPVIVALGHLSWWAFAWLLPSMHRTS